MYYHHVLAVSQHSLIPGSTASMAVKLQLQDPIGSVHSSPHFGGQFVLCTCVLEYCMHIRGGVSVGRMYHDVSICCSLVHIAASM